MQDLSNFINTIIQGDCIEVMKEIPDNSIDLVVTSPPYNIGIDYGTYKDNLSWIEYYDWCEKWLIEIYRALKDDGRFCLNHYLSIGNSQERTAPLMVLNSLAMEIGFQHHSCAIWEDTSLSSKTSWGSWMSASAPYISSPFEGILILYKEFWQKQNKGKSTIEKNDFIMSTKGIWNIGTERQRLTPCPFPKKLPNLCINLLTYENDIVLDPFMGSGTTIVVCKELKRRYIGIEIDEKIYKVARNRISSMTGFLF